MKVLFVCMGNICRSPTAHGVFARLVAERAPHAGIVVDSAGTHGYHTGSPPDPRAIAAARRRGVDLSPLRARQVEDEDFERYDLILAMDRGNRDDLLGRCPPSQRERVRLFLEFAGDSEVDEVPDPYYGGPVGFERVLDLVEAAAEGLLADLLERRVRRA